MTETPGTVGEEAARLAAAVQQWVRQAGGAGLVGLGAHVATGSPECHLCPFCQLVSLVKHANPEVVRHLSEASSAVFAAVRAALDARDRAWEPRAAGGLEHIDIS